MKLIVGLGNPGKEYRLTRHNVGFLAIDRLAELDKDCHFMPDRKSKADICKMNLDEKRVILVKPQTFMNNSGLSVRVLMDFFKIKIADLIVIHDDKDIPLGTTKVHVNRGPAGHNGVRSLVEQLGTQNFTRIRIGVAPVGKTIVDTADFVLGKFTKEEQRELKQVLENVVTNTIQLVR